MRSENVKEQPERTQCSHELLVVRDDDLPARSTRDSTITCWETTYNSTGPIANGDCQAT